MCDSYRENLDVIPRKLGDDLRRRRMALRLRQEDIAKGLGVSRGWVSACERGVEWDPDADKLVLWAKALNLEPDYILKRTGRASFEGMEPASPLPPGLVEAIAAAVAAGVRDGVALALAELRDEAADLPGGPPPEPPS